VRNAGYAFTGVISGTEEGEGTGQVSIITGGVFTVAMTADKRIDTEHLTVESGGGITISNGSGALSYSGGRLTAAENSDISLTSQGNLSLGSLTLQAVNGTVTLTANDSGRITMAGTGLIEAELLVAAGHGMIDLTTQVDRIQADMTGAGDLAVNEQDGVDLEHVSAPDGIVYVTAGGTLTATEVEASSDIILTSLTGSVLVGSVTVQNDGDVQGVIRIGASEGTISEADPNDGASDLTGYRANLQAQEVFLNSPGMDWATQEAVAGLELDLPGGANGDLERPPILGNVEITDELLAELGIGAGDDLVLVATGTVTLPALTTIALGSLQVTAWRDLVIDSPLPDSIPISLESRQSITVAAGQTLQTSEDLKLIAGGGILQDDGEAVAVDVGGKLTVESRQQGDVKIHGVGDGTLVVEKAAVSDGDIEITADNGLTVEQLDALTDSENQVSLATGNSANLTLGLIDAGRRGELNLASTGSISMLDENSVVQGRTLDATSTSAVELVTELDVISIANSGAGGSITVTETAAGGDLKVASIVQADGNTGEISVTAEDGSITILPAAAPGDPSIVAGGDITLTAGGDDTVIDIQAPLESPAQVSLSAGYRVIGGVTEGYDIEAASLSLQVGHQAGTNEDPLSTKVGSLEAHAANSTIVLNNEGELTIEGTGVSTVDSGTIIIRTSDAMILAAAVNAGAGGGSIVLEASRGDLTLIGTVTAEGGDITLTSGQGIVNGAAAGVTNVTGLTITLSAGTSIGTAQAPVTTDVESGGTVTATAAVDIYLTETDGDLGLTRISTPEGDVFLQAENGSIVDAADNVLPNVLADTVTLTASGGIGETGDPLEIVVSGLEAHAGGSMIVIENEGDLSIVNGGVSMAADAPVIITTTGAMTVAAGIEFSAPGGMLLLDTGWGDLTITGNITASDAAITLLGQDDVIQGAGSTVLNTGGTIDIEAGDVITQADGALISSGDAAAGDILLQAAGDITLAGIEAGTGRVALVTSEGSILDAGDVHTDVSGGGLWMSAVEGIIGVLGDNSDPLELTVSVLAAASGGPLTGALYGGINLQEADDVTVGEVSVSVERVTEDGTVSDSIVSGSDLTTTDNGAIELRTVAGSITVENGTTLDDGTGISANGSGNILLVAAGAGADINLSADVTTASGEIALYAADRLWYEDGVAITTTHPEIDVVAPNGIVTPGNVSLGNTPGLLTIDGSQTFTADQALVFEIGGYIPGGTAQGNHDLVVITGEAVLDGILDISFVNGFEPVEGNEFEILTFASAQGHFTFGRGQFGFGDGSLYMDVIQYEDRLVMVAAPRAAADLVEINADTKLDNDKLGTFFNGDYFGYRTFEVDAALVVSEFFHVNGRFFLENGEKTIRLTDGYTVEEADTLLWRIGGDDLVGFAGVHGPADNEGAIGFAMTGLDFGLAFYQELDTERAWVSVKATCEAVDQVGMEAVNIQLSAKDVSVSVNAGNAGNFVVDYSFDPLTVNTGPGSFDLDFDGDDGTLIMAAGYFDLAVFDFFYLSGNLGFEKSSERIVLADGTEVYTDMLTVGGTGLDAFVGLNGPYRVDSDNDGDIDNDDTPNAAAIGLSLGDVEFGLVLFSPKVQEADEVQGLNWMGLEATAGTIDIAGIPGTTVAVRNLAVAINRVNGVPAETDPDTRVVDFKTRPLDVVTGTDMTTTLTMDGAKGLLTRVSGDFTLAIFDFFYVSGSLGFEKYSSTVRMTDGTEVEADLMTMAGTGLDAFVGIGPYFTDSDEDGDIDGDDTPNEDAIGLALSDVAFAYILIAPEEGQEDVAGLKWTTLTASAGAVSILGLPSVVTIAPRDISVAINRVDGVAEGTDPDTMVLDFAAEPLTVVTGTGSSTIIDIDGNKGQLVRAAGAATLAISDFFYADGSVGFERSRQEVELADGTVVETNLLTVGGTGLDAFVGLHGPYLVDSDNDGDIDDDDTPNAAAMGLSLGGLEFGLAMLYPEEGQPEVAGLQWTGLEASADSVELVGIPQITVSAKNIAVAINRVSGVAEGVDPDTRVVDFAGDPLDIVTGTGTSMDMTMPGSKGELIRASGDIELAVSSFFYVAGSLGFEKSGQAFTLADDTAVETDLLTIGGTGLDAFVGINGPYLVDSDDDGDIDDDDTPNEGALGLSLGGLEFGLAIITPKEGQEDVAGMDWYALQASADSAEIVGIPGITVAAKNMAVAINQVNGVPEGTDAATRVVDFAADPLDVVTGTGSSLAMNMDGGQGRLIRATGDIELAVSGFFYVAGSLGFEKSDTTVRLTDGTEVAANLLTVGGTGLTAFAGINGPYLVDSDDDGDIDDDDTPNSDAIGLSLDGVEFGLAIISPRAGQAEVEGLSWTALQASAGSAELLGIPGVTAAVRNVSVAFNQVDGVPAETDPDTRVVDFAAVSLDVVTGTDTSLTLDMDGGRGNLTSAAGDVELALSDFFYVGGSVGFEKYTTTVQLADGTEVETDLLTVGGTGLYAFAGINGPYLVDSDDDGDIDGNDTPNEDAIGLSLGGVEFGLALFSPKADQPEVEGLKWTALQAGADSVSLVGVPAVTASVEDIAVTINQVDGVPAETEPSDRVVDFAAGPLAVVTGTDTSLTLDMAGSDGQLIRASGSVDLAVSGFFYVRGSAGFERSREVVHLADGTEVETDLLTVGGTNLEAFAGINGPYLVDSNDDGTIDDDDTPNADAIGLSLGGVEFALALLSPQADQEHVAGMRWTGLEARASSVDFRGIPEITVSADDVEVVLNLVSGVTEGIDPDTMVVDFGAAPLDVFTGTDSTLALDMPGSKGEWIRASGTFELGISGFFYVAGSLGFEKYTENVKLADGTEVATDLMAIGGTGLYAFAGINGPYLVDSDEDGDIDENDTPNELALGLSLGNVEFALAILSPKAEQPDVAGLNWLGLQATAGSVELVGIPQITASVKNIAVTINHVGGVPDGTDPTDLVVDFGAAPLEVITGTGTSLALDMPGSEGRMIRASGDVELAISDFFYIAGSVGFEKSTETVTLADGTEVETDLMTIGGTGLTAFAGINGPYLVDSNNDGVIDDSDTPNEGAMGLSLGDVEFGLALLTAKPGQDEEGMQWTALKASAGSVELVGISDLTIAATDISVIINEVSNVPQGWNPAIQVIDFAAAPLDVITGTGSSLALDMSGDQGRYVRAEAQLEMNLAGFVTLEGGFTFERAVLETETVIKVGAADVEAFLGSSDGTTGVRVFDAHLGMILYQDSAGGSTYALDAGGSAQLAGFEGSLSLAGTIAVRANTTGEAVDETITVGDTAIELLFADGEFIQRLEGTGIALDIFGVITLEGNFVFVRGPPEDGITTITVGAFDVGAFLGVGETGLLLVNGTLGLVLLDENGISSYALTAKGTTALTVEDIVGISQTVEVNINHTGEAVDETIEVGEDSVHVYYEDGTDVEEFNVSEFDLLLDGLLAGWIDELAGSMIDLRADLLPVTDEGGNVTYPSIISTPIPGTDASLDSMLGISPLLSMGDYLQHYLHPNMHPDEVLPEDDTIPVGVYGELGPTLKGLLEYLEEHWVPTLGGENESPLTIELTDTGFKLAFKTGLDFETDINLTFGQDFHEFGLTVDGDVTLGVEVQTDIDFELSFDWMSGAFAFNLNELGFQAEAYADDIYLGAAFGPLQLSIGEEDGERASAAINLDGSISYIGGDFSLNPGENSFSLNMPIFASLAGVNLSPGETPRVIFGGQLFGGDGLTFTTENFDNILNFKDLSAADVILMIPDFLTYLDDLNNSGTLQVGIPFLQTTLDAVLDFASGFKRDVVDKIDFYRPRVDLVTGSNGTMEAESDIFHAIGAGFTEDMEGEYLTIEGVGTFQIDMVTDSDTLDLDDIVDEELADGEFAVHERLEKIQTLQEFVVALNDSGVANSSYDPVTQVFSVPLSFVLDLDPLEFPIDFGFDFGDAFGLSTEAVGVLRASVSGGLTLVVDLDGPTGTEGLYIGIDQAVLSGTASFDVEDLEVAARIGFMGLAAGGQGTGSGIHVEAEVSLGLDRYPDSDEPGDQLFNFMDLINGELFSALDVDFSGEAYARLKGLALTAGPASLPIAPEAEIGIYVQDLLSWDTITTVNQDITQPLDLPALVEAGTVGASDVVLVLPDLSAAFDFSELSFADIISGIRFGLEAVQGLLEDQPFYNDPLPLINRSIGDVFSFMDDFLGFIEAAADNDQETIQEAEAAIEAAMGLTDDNTLPFHEQKFALRVADGVLDVHVNFSAVFSAMYTFSLNLGSFAAMSGNSGAAELEGVDNLTDSMGVGAGGNIELAAFVEFELDLGIDFSNIEEDKAPVIFLYDYDPDTGDGTHLSLGGRVKGQDLALGFHLGPLKIGVDGGYAVIDGDGDLATDDYAMFTLSLDQEAGTENDDGRYYLFDENLLENIQFGLVGAFDVSLPIRLEVLGFELQMGDPLAIKSNPVYGDQGLTELLKYFAGTSAAGAESPVIFTYPDIAGAFAELGGKFSILNILNDPGFILDGVDSVLGVIQDIFGSSLAHNIPLIGDKLYEAATMIRDFRNGFLADLREKLSGNGKAIQYMRDTLFDVLGPDGLNILMDSNFDGFVSMADIRVTWVDENGEELEKFEEGEPVPDGADAVQFDVSLGGVLVAVGIDIPLNIDLPGFGLGVDGGLALELGWSFDFGLGISLTDGIYLATNEDGENPELELGVKAFLDGEPTDPNITTPFSGYGKLLFFKATIQDTDRFPNTWGFQPSGLFGALDINYTGNERGRLTTDMIFSSDFFSLFDVNFGVDAELNLLLTLELDVPGGGLPKLMADLVIDWGWDIKTGSSVPVIELRNLRIDIGSMITDFLKPIAETIQDIMEPFKPVIQSLITEIPGLGVFGVDPPNLMGFIDMILKIKGGKPIDWSFVYAAQEMFGIVDTVNSMLGMEGTILLGDIVGLGSGDYGTNALEPFSPEELTDFLDQLEEDSKGGYAGGSATDRSGFKFFEYIKDVNNWMNIFTGGDAILFTYEMPLLEFGAGFDILLASIPLGTTPFILDISAQGNVTAGVDLAFGFDTYGIRQAIDTGNYALVMDGFYVMDFTMPQFADGKVVAGTGWEEKPEFYMNAYVGLLAELSIFIFSAGLRGGVEMEINIDLQDIGRSTLTKDPDGYVTDVVWESDGKIRVSEMITMWTYENGGLGNLLNIDGGMDFVADLVLKAKFPFLGSITLLDYELFRINLFSFDYNAPYVTPYLAMQDGDTLYVNSGPRAGERQYFNIADGGETFIFSGSDGTVNIEFDNWYRTYTGVEHLVVDGGAGDDVLDASRLDYVTVEMIGGAGDDTLIAGSAGSTIRGGDGDDELIAAEGDDILYGEAGQDRLIGGAGDDLINGGTGFDSLNGGEGIDTFQFGDDYGSDTFNDEGDTMKVDFSLMTTGLTGFVSRRGMRFVDENGGEFAPLLPKVTSIILGSGDDTLHIRDYPEGTLDIRDTGGSDTYHVVAGRGASSLETGIINLTDEGGSFDDIIMEQTRPAEALVLDTHKVTNGREILNYDSGIDRLTIRGGTSQYNGNGIVYFGGAVSITSTGDGALDLKNTGLRIVGQSFEYDREIKAGHFIFDTFEAISFGHRLNACNDGYIDVRFYEDDADIVLTVDLLVSSGDSWDGAGAGWIRLTAHDGSIINQNGVSILGAGSHLILKALNEIGTSAAPILTQVAELTAVTPLAGTGNIVVIETDDLELSLTGDHPVPRNPGLLKTDAALLPDWRDEITWDDDITEAWLAETADGNDVYAVAAATGYIDILLTEADSRLSLLTGLFTAPTQGMDITLTADDFDFFSGAEQVIGTDELLLRATSLAWNYYLGTAAEDSVGQDVARDHFENSMDLTTRDLAAIADGFTLITIGRRDAGNTMTLGDAYDADTIKAIGVERLVNASFRDHTILLSDHVSVQGDVQASDDLLEIHTRTMTVNAINLHVPFGLPDSGVMAKTLELSIDEQLHVGGWLRGTESITIDIHGTAGDDPLATYPNGWNSLVTDAGSSIETTGDASVIDIAAVGSIRVAGLIEVHGTASQTDINTDTIFMLLQGGIIAGRDTDNLLDIAAYVIAINPGSAISAGAEFDSSSGTPVPVQTAAGADIMVTSAHELLIGGSVTSSDGMVLTGGTSVYDGLDYGDSIYDIYNKSAYFYRIGELDPNHYLIGHSGYGLMVTGTITTLAGNSLLTLSSTEDVIIRGNINVNGQDSDLTIQSDIWIYIEGFLTVQDEIKVLGGMDLQGATLEGADRNGTSVYVHATSQVTTLQSGSSITITGANDVDILGAVVAAGVIGETGVTSTGPDGVITVTAGEQVRIDSGLVASGTVVINGGDTTDSYALIDLTDDEATDMSFFSVLVDLVSVGPIDVSSAQTGSALAARLNAGQDFVDAGLTAAWSSDVLTITLSGLREGDINRSGGKSLSIPQLLTGVPEEVDEAITGTSEIFIDVTDELASDLSTFSLVVDTNPVGPIDVSSATSGAALADILNAAQYFVADGLTAAWSGDVLTVSHPTPNVVLRLPVLLSGAPEEIDAEIVILSGESSSVEIEITNNEAANLSSFAITVDSTPISPFNVNSVESGTDLADLLNDRLRFTNAGLTAEWSNGVLTLTHDGIAVLSGFAFLDGESQPVDLTVDISNGQASRAKFDLAHNGQGQLANQYPLRLSLSTFGITVDGTPLGSIDVSSAGTGAEVAEILNADGGFAAAGLTAAWADGVLTVTHDGLAELTMVSLKTGLAVDVDEDITGRTVVQIDVADTEQDELAIQFPVRTSLSTFTVTLDTVELGPFDVSAAVSGATLAALLNAEEALIEAGLVFEFSDDVLTVTRTQPGRAVSLADSSLLTGETVSVDEFIFVNDDRALGVLVDTAGGLTSQGLSTGDGGHVTVFSPDGNIEIMGNIVSGGVVELLFGDEGQLLSKTISYDEAGYSDVTIEAGGQVFIGGTTNNADGDPVQTGGYIQARDAIEITGGSHASDNGVYIHAVSELTTGEPDGTITITSEQDANIQGLLLPGGKVTNIYDANGVYLGRTITDLDGDSTIRIEAGHQVRIGGSLLAGALIDLIGDVDPVEPDPVSGANLSGRGILVIGSAQLSTWRPYGEIRMTGAGPIELQAAAHTYELLADSWIITGDGRLTHNVILSITVDHLDFEYAGTATITAESTADNLSIDDLLLDIQAALENGVYTVTSSSSQDYPAQSLFTDFADDPVTENKTDPDMIIKLRDSKLLLTGAYEFTLVSELAEVDGDVTVVQGEVSFAEIDVSGQPNFGLPEFVLLNNFSVTVDGDVVGPIDLTAATDVESLLALLNNNGTFTAAGLTAEWANDELRIVHGDSAVLTDVVLVDREDQAMDDTIEIIGGGSQAVIDLLATVTLDSFSVTVDGVPVTVNVSAATDGDSLAAAINADNDFDSAGLTASWAAGVLTITHDSIAELTDLSLTTSTEAQIDEIITVTPGFASTAGFDLSETAAADLLSRFAEMSLFGLTVDGTPVGPIDITGVDTSQALVDLLNADTGFAAAGLTASWEADILTITHDSVAALSEPSLKTEPNTGLLGFDLSGGDLTPAAFYNVVMAEKGSEFTIGSPEGPNDEITIAGRLKVYDGISLYSGEQDDITLDYTGLLETIDGTVTITAGAKADLKGDIFARGAGSNVFLQAGQVLSYEGTIQADSQIVLTADTVETPGGTGTMGTTGEGGGIVVASQGDVVISSLGGPETAGLDNLQIGSVTGDVTVGADSGVLQTDARVKIIGVNVEVTGTFISTAVTDDALDFELVIEAFDTVTIHGDIKAAGSILITAGEQILVYDAEIESTGTGQRVRFEADGSITFGKIGYGYKPGQLNKSACCSSPFF